ncbi:MAG TPA: DNA polymerase III subunit delta, partial [Lachnospiraceae bacterium]|nr:DNA polymerase III subunit delta [Lachnospiraceae bacterium]
MAGFNDIIGQEHLKEHLQKAIKTGNLSHAYMISGEKGSGKEFVANIFAMTLQCEKGGVEPCMECHSCRQAMTKNQPDIITVTHEKPNTISVEDIREQIVGDVAVKPYASKWKLYIIKDGEKMSVQAQNALLKTLEEPPSYVIILILTANSSMLLETIRSRCTE